MTLVKPGSEDAGPDNLRGILLMVGAFATFSILDASAKLLGRGYPIIEVVFARYAIAMLFTIPPVLWRSGPGVLKTRRPELQILRSIFLLTASGCNFGALLFLRLDQTAAILFATPLIVCVAAVPLLSERIGPRRWAAVVIGFIGVLLIVRPGFDSFHWAMLLSLSSAVVTALYQITTRKLAAFDSPETTLLYTSLPGVLLLVPAAPFYSVVPDLAGAALMLLMGFCGAFGHYLLIRAHHLAPAPILAPFSYSQILWMIALGYLIFAELPDRWTLLGASIVVASGLYVYHRERVRAIAARQAAG